MSTPKARSMEKAYKFYAYTKNQGLRKAISKTRHYVTKRLTHVKKNIDVMVAIEDVVKADFVKFPYKKPNMIADTKIMDIAWVLSPLSPGSGGQNTIIRFCRYLVSQGHMVTLYIYEAIQPQSVQEAKKILKDSFNITTIKVKKIADYKGSDAVICTGWETAYPVFNLDTKAHKFYFVQDFEPYFYGVGSKTILAENTYKMNFHGITAGRWLSTKLKNEYGMESDFFEFGTDLDTYKLPSSSKVVKKKKICFYARPVTERRAFELGVIALDIFHQKHPDYIIEFIGWDVADYNIPFPYVNRGILSHDELAALYHECVVGLVLSLTNVSLLPLELLAGGCIPVINEGDNNRLVLGENKYIKYAHATPGEISEAIEQVIERPHREEVARQASESVDSLSWESSYKSVESVLRRELSGK